jgi:hypothetical protein
MRSDEIKKMMKDCAGVVSAEYNESRTGVPRIIVDLGECKASIIYVNKEDRWKLFWPFPAKNQIRVYFDNFKQVTEYVHDRREKAKNRTV